MCRKQHTTQYLTNSSMHRPSTRIPTEIGFLGWILGLWEWEDKEWEKNDLIRLVEAAAILNGRKKEEKTQDWCALNRKILKKNWQFLLARKKNSNKNPKIQQKSVQTNSPEGWNLFWRKMFGLFSRLRLALFCILFRSWTGKSPRLPLTKLSKKYGRPKNSWPFFCLSSRPQEIDLNREFLTWSERSLFVVKTFSSLTIPKKLQSICHTPTSHWSNDFSTDEFFRKFGRNLLMATFSSFGPSKNHWNFNEISVCIPQVTHFLE